MKTIAVENNQPVSECLPEASDSELVLLTVAGRTKYAVVPFDEGDEEIAAMRRNSALMADILDRVARARQQPGKSLADLKAELDGHVNRVRKAFDEVIDENAELYRRLA